MNKHSKSAMWAVVSLILTLAIATNAYATTITVDGIRESAWDPPAGSQSDPNEGTINDRHDIQTVGWTNDTQNFYFLFDTYGDTRWDNLTGPDPILTLCINTDNNNATGTSASCGGSGYDRYVTIEGPPPLTVTVYDDDGTTPVAASTSVANANDITELSINVAALQLNSTNCNPSGTVPVGVLFEGMVFPADEVQDGGIDIMMNCGSPTAITLTNLSAQNSSGLLAASVVGLILLGGGLFLLIRNRKLTAT